MHPQHAPTTFGQAARTADAEMTDAEADAAAEAAELLCTRGYVQFNYKLKTLKARKTCPDMAGYGRIWLDMSSFC